MFIKKQIAACIGLTALVAYCGVALAQEDASSDSALEPVEKSASAATAPRKIDEVVVTATKREQSLRDIPASIAAFSGDDLEEKGKLGLEEYLQETPGVVMTSGAPGVSRIIVRGISTDSSPVTPIPSAVGTFIGDTAFSDPFLTNVVPDLSAFDLASVEVLKGPQGTIFGGAALAGAVRYVLNQPNLEEFEVRGFGQVSVPTDGTIAQTYGVGGNVPIIEDKLALRAVYIDREYSGSFDDLRRDREDVNEGGGKQIRVALKWQPWEALQITLTHLEQDFAAADGVAAASNRKRREYDNVFVNQPIENSFQLDTLRIDYDLDFMKAVYLLSYTEKYTDVFADITKAIIGNPPQGYPQEAALITRFENDSSAYTHELRFQSSGDGDFNWIAGLYYFDYELDFYLYGHAFAADALLGPSGPLIPLTDALGDEFDDLEQQTSVYHFQTATKAEELAGFFDLSYRMFDALTVTAGARLYKTTVDGGYHGRGALGRVAGSGDESEYFQVQEEDGISPKFTATYEFNDDYSIYGQAARGFRFGGIQSVPRSVVTDVPESYRSDSLWNYEVGVRTSWFGQSLNLDVTVFKIFLEDMQISQKTENTELLYRDNIGSAESEGFEASLFWLPPIEGLSFALTGGMINAIVTEAFETADGDIVESGDELPGSAEYQYSVSLTYFSALTTRITASTFISYTYLGPGYGDLIHSEEVMDYGELDFGVTFAADFGSVRPVLAVNVSNALDEVGSTRGTTGTTPDQAEVSSFLLNAPRTISTRLTVAF